MAVKTSTGAKSSGSAQQPPKTSDKGAAPDPDVKMFQDMSDLTPAERKRAEAIAVVYAAAGTMLTAAMQGEPIPVFDGEEIVSLRYDNPKNPGLYHTGRALSNLSEKVAVQWIVLSRTNDSVRKWIDRIQNSVSQGGILSIHLLLLAPMLVTAGAVPAPFAPIANMIAGVATGDVDESLLGL